MYRFIYLVSLLYTSAAFAQTTVSTDSLNGKKVVPQRLMGFNDSIAQPIAAPEIELYSFQWFENETYQCYLQGNWDKLIETGKAAESRGISYKYLHQRVGYANYSKGNYFAAEQAYTKAYRFDTSDQLTLLYLYYCASNRGDYTASHFYGSKLSVESKKALNISSFKLIDAVDAEYNYKYNNSTSRSNPLYYRLGLQSQLSHRLSLYFAGSEYQQTVSGLKISQPEFYTLLNWTTSATSSLGFGFHYVNTQSGISIANSYLGIIDWTKRFNRFKINATASLFSTSTKSVKQFSLSGGYVFGNQGVLMINSTLIGMVQPHHKQFNFAQSVTIHPFKKIWLDGRVVLGNLDNYNDNRGLYVYNSLDPTTFRAGATLFWSLNNHLSLSFDYTIDQKEITTINYQYYQQSFSGGISWKF